jgi:potassium efflux system protein
MVFRCLGLLLVAGILTAVASPGSTQPEPASIADVAGQIDSAEAQLDAVEAGGAKPTADDAALTANVAALATPDQALDAAVAILTPRLAGIDARLAQLGPVPNAGQPPETTEIATERARLLGDRITVATELKQANLVIVELDQTVAHLEQARRELFARNLWAQSRSLLSPELWREVVAAFPNDVHRLALPATAEARQASAAARRPGVVIGWLLTAAIAAVVALLARHLLIGLGQRRAAKVASRFGWSLLALWRVGVVVLTALTAAWLARAVLIATDTLTPSFAHMAAIIVRAVTFAALIDGLGRALLSVNDPAARIVPLGDALAARLRHFPTIIGVAVAFAGIFAGVHQVFGTSLASSVASDSIGVCFQLAAIVAALTVAGRDRGLAIAAPTAARGTKLPWILAALATWLGLIAAALAVIFGYLALANFIMREIVWIAVVLASLFILVRSADDLFPALFQPASRLGRAVIVAVGVSAATLEQIGIVLSGLARVALLVVGWMLIVAPFGAGASDVFGRITSDDMAIRLGTTSISPGTILGGVVIFAAGMFITRGIRGWLEARYLPATAIDIGVRTSLVSGVTYLGAVLAVVFASIFLGVSLDRIALFASALSIGIGFGLQSIVSNFVAGLILLIERPVKVGDWIAIGDLEGDIRKVNVRATEIEMKDQSRLIVPNLDLITKTVRNVTHAGALGRVRIIFRVHDAADPIALRTLVLALLKAHAEVLADPAPSIYLTDAKDGGLEFTCFAFLQTAREVYSVRSDLLFAIVPALKANGFALASSSTIVNLGVDGRLIEPAPQQA